jgi:hypothetical protein
VGSWGTPVHTNLQTVVEVVNGCAEPVAVEFQLVFRDGEGKVVDESRFWCYKSNTPPYYLTFPPGESCVHTGTIIESRALDIRTMTAKVIEVRTQKQKDEWLRR